MIKLRNILSEIGTDPKTVFGNIVFGDVDNDFRYSKFVRLQGKTGSEKNTEIENQILSNLLKWIQNSNYHASIALYNKKELFKKAKSKFPSIFKPESPNGAEVYRGLKEMPSSLISSLQKKFDPNDYTKVKIGGKTFYKYNKPVLYKPHKDVQSWTSSQYVARTFSIPYSNDVPGCMIISEQNDEYFFNQKVMNYFASAILDTQEYEILHFGKKYSKPVFVALDSEVFQAYIQPAILSKKPTDAKQIENILSLLKVKKYTINSDLTVDVNGTVNMDDRDLTSIPIKFGIVTGNFICTNNRLTTLKNTPREVGGYFDCSFNKLTTLKGSPKKVGTFACRSNSPRLTQTEKKWAEKNINAEEFEW